MPLSEVRATVQSIALAAMSMGMIVGYLSWGYVFENLGGESVFFGAMCAAGLATLVFLSVPRGSQPEPSLQPCSEGNKT